MHLRDFLCKVGALRSKRSKHEHGIYHQSTPRLALDLVELYVPMMQTL